MSFINNKKHFLHSLISEVEPLDILGKNGGFENYLEERGIYTGGMGKSTINWQYYSNYFSFEFDLEGLEDSIKIWLKNSRLKEYEHLMTWFSWEDPIIKVKTNDVFEYWEEFNVSAAWEPIVFLTEDGKLFFEFTEHPRLLNSNFKIYKNT